MFNIIKFAHIKYSCGLNGLMEREAASKQCGDIFYEIMLNMLQDNLLSTDIAQTQSSDR